MIAGDLIDVEVRDADGERLGYVVDLRLVLDRPPEAGAVLAGARLHGLVVSPRTRTSFLGYERTSVRAPWPIAQLLRRRHRGSFLVHWPDVASVPSLDATRRGKGAIVVLRRGFDRYDPALT